MVASSKGPDEADEGKVLEGKVSFCVTEWAAVLFAIPASMEARNKSLCLWSAGSGSLPKTGEFSLLEYFLFMFLQEMEHWM